MADTGSRATTFPARILKLGPALVLLTMACSAHGQGAATKSQPAAASGKQVFARWCSACHAPGPNFPATASLAVKYGKETPAALEQRTDLTPEIVGYFVRNGVQMMPSFRKTEISDAELKALGDYLAHKKGK